MAYGFLVLLVSALMIWYLCKKKAQHDSWAACKKKVRACDVEICKFLDEKLMFLVHKLQNDIERSGFSVIGKSRVQSGVAEMIISVDEAQLTAKYEAVDYGGADDNDTVVVCNLRFILDKVEALFGAESYLVNVYEEDGSTVYEFGLPISYFSGEIEESLGAEFWEQYGELCMERFLLDLDLVFTRARFMRPLNF